MMKDRARTLLFSYMGVLLFLFVLKILGVKNLELMCENEVIVKLCNFIDNTFIKYICSFAMYFITTVLTLHSIFSTKKFIGKQKIIYIVIIIGEVLRTIFLEYGFILTFVDIFIFIILPLLYDKKLFFKSLVVVILVFLFQLISFFVKGISIHEHHIDNTLTAIIYSLDYVIMLFLLRDYFIDLIFRKEKKNNG